MMVRDEVNKWCCVVQVEVPQHVLGPARVVPSQSRAAVRLPPRRREPALEVPGGQCEGPPLFITLYFATTGRRVEDVDGLLRSGNSNLIYEGFSLECGGCCIQLNDRK